MPEIKVENIVASTSFAEKLDLDMISQSLEETEYEPEQFPGLVYRIKEPKVAMLLFGSGKIVCTGARKVSDVSVAVDKLSKELSSLGLIRKK
jgi:transcription initiation factor TFIID TATA-box-binding protein